MASIIINYQHECLELLHDVEGTNLFRDYLKTAYASEVLNLWIEIQLFRELVEHKELYNKGNTFMRSIANMEKVR